LALLAAAADASLPIASVTVLASPFDVRDVPLVAPPRPLLALTDAPGAINRLCQAVGLGPLPLVRWGFELSSFQRLVTKPLAMARNLDDADYLAQLEAVDRFTDRMTAYRGRTFGQLYHRLLKGNALVEGTFTLDDRTISVADISVPVLVVAGANDGIAPIASVRSVMPLLSGSGEVRLEIVPGGHLGMLTGRRARTSTWPLMDAWVEEWSESQAEEPVPRRPAAKKAAAKRTARRSTGRTPAPTEEDAATIGANPQRRHGSQGSRALRR